MKLTSSIPRLFSFLTVVAMLSACGGGGGSSSGGGVPATPTPTPTPTLGPLGNVACTAFGTSTASSARQEQQIPKRRPAMVTTQGFVSGEIAVQYRGSDARLPQSIDSSSLRETRTLALGHLGTTLRTYAVDDSKIDATLATLRSQPGVISASRIGTRHILSSHRYLTSDPYFSEPVPGSPPSGYVQPTAPCYESQSVPGQWDMHQVGLDFAFGYSQPGNSIAPNANALGSPGVKLAIIDTGADLNHPELTGGKVVYQKCIITQTGIPAGTGCASVSDVTDYDGHGTDVAGIAAANISNGFGFVGDGGNISLMIYRIFPQDPAGGCEHSNSAQCSASLADEAAAIGDAVANGAKIISMSLGGSGSDPTESAAVANAVAAGVVVVAASGNETKATLDCPACYPGVIAVGASALVDSVPNGSGKSSASPIEDVASYSNYDSTHSTTWGLVAPGGDPTSGDAQGCQAGSGDCDDLHWIENIYSTQTTVQPGCTTDASHSLFGETNDCRTLIAGTSQATPHVAGAVGLLLSVKPGLSPAQVAAALQASATNIGDPKQGYGRLNVYRLIANALGDSSP